MSDLVKRKNLKAKKGKKDWARNIEVSELQESLIKKNMEDEVLKKKKS